MGCCLLEVGHDAHEDRYQCVDSVLIDYKLNRVDNLLHESRGSHFDRLVVKQVNEQDEGVTCDVFQVRVLEVLY